MVRQLSLLLVPVSASLHATEVHKQALQNTLQMHNIQPEQASAMSQAWALEQRDRELEAWSVEDWRTQDHPERMHKDGYVIKKVTYTSPAIKLKTGEAHFTVNTVTHSPFPKGDYSLLSNAYRVVEDNDPSIQVPLSEVYLHHWLMGDKVDVNPLNYCEDDYYWGYGSEMRGMDYTVPDGYAMKRIGSSGKCGLNMHFIRVDDLALEWKGFNNPNGSWGAAVKNCAECGWAPSRATECLKGLDGSFACCFTYSRCPVNNKADKAHKSYALQYDIEYTDELGPTLKDLRGTVLDVSGGAIEWNIDAGYKGANTVCGDTHCETIDSWVAGTQRGFGNGICSGEMLWSYTHQHIGSINSTLFINGEPHCTSYPVQGTDPSNPAGNEKGFNVKYTNCVDKETLGNNVRINKGDKVEIRARYSVDKAETMNLPLPGGKHGGIMVLFFAMMDCDAGTFGEIYVCRQDTCVPTFKSHVKSSEIFQTKGDCQSSCGTVSV